MRINSGRKCSCLLASLGVGSKLGGSSMLGTIARAVTVTVFVCSASLTTAPAAQADSGFCGVKASGPDVTGGAYVYVVRNKCSSALRFRVYLPYYKRYAFYAGSTATCGSVPAGSAKSYVAVDSDPNWQIKSC